MAYTHTIVYHEELTKPQWIRVIDDYYELVEEHLPPITATAGGLFLDTPLRVLTIRQDQELVILNAQMPHSPGGDELFLWRRRKLKDSKVNCNTERLPYDLVVCGLLLRAYHHAPQAIEIRSDGTARDWRPAIQWVEQVFGEQKLPPLLQTRTVQDGDATLAQRAIAQAPWLFRVP